MKISVVLSIVLMSCFNRIVTSETIQQPNTIVHKENITNIGYFFNQTSFERDQKKLYKKLNSADQLLFDTAFLNNNSNMIKELIKTKKTIDYNYLGKAEKIDILYQYTPLIAAIAHGFDEMAEAILQAGADPLKHDGLKFNALDHAIMKRSLTSIKLLYRYYAWPPYYNKIKFSSLYQLTPTKLLSFQNESIDELSLRLEIVDLLIRARGIDTQDINGNSLLTIAIKKNDNVSFAYLLSNKAAVNQVLRNGLAPLTVAFRCKRNDFANSLLQNGASPTTALENLINYTNSLSLVEDLLAVGAKVGAQFSPNSTIASNDTCTISFAHARRNKNKKVQQVIDRIYLAFLWLENE